MSETLWAKNRISELESSLSQVRGELARYEKEFEERGFAFQKAVQDALSERDALKREVEEQRVQIARSLCKLCEGSFGNHALECPVSKDAEIARLRVALEKIGEVDEEGRYTEADAYHCSWKKCQEIASSALSDKKGAV